MDRLDGANKWLLLCRSTSASKAPKPWIFQWNNLYPQCRRRVQCHAVIDEQWKIFGVIIIIIVVDAPTAA